ncbi:hypothetical protein MIND_01011200 [Mycena indigotica]|uniref:Peptidase C14 caspase domain-containing protein n=1 Tax=Mycena indigotica TaxID=2126181 RepID=A0A8H6VYC3_9AGAR|nr:uncharacterized protein MIND_01011200 [Mycena indigotica]KAF7294738.1 hypothetical protein MIND_01011200 [Mycena indigotica]
MPPQLFALCIGLDEYAHPEIENLQGCVKDVSSLQDALELRFPGAQIRSLKNQEATRKGILDSFTAHLVENENISMGDPILVYFAGYGQRLEGEEREVDALIPYDYAPDIPPIFDATIHGLLHVLVQTKGLNVTLILDCCFSPVLALSNVRRIVDPSWSSHLVDFRRENNLAGYGGFFNDDQAYVSIAASSKHRHCNDSAAGGFFTQDMVLAMRSSWPLSCRELTVLTQRWETSTRGQVSVCYGPYLDRLLYMLPELHVIAKLRVFTNVDLSPHLPEKSESDAFCLVSSRWNLNTNVVVHPSRQSTANIQRLDRLTARYGTRLVSFPLRKVPQVLNGVARFNHYLNLRPSLTKYSCVERLSGLRRGKHNSQSSSVEVYHFKPDGEDGAWISDNILHDGVVHLDNVPNDHLLGLKITNISDQAMYPYVLHFDTDTYEINVLYSPFREGEGLPPKLLKPHESLIFGRCPNPDDLGFDIPEIPFGIFLDEDKTERTAEIIKVILAQKPIAVGYMAQASPMTSGEERGGNLNPEVHEEIPGVWRTETVTFAVPANFRNGNYAHSSSRALPLGLWRRLKRKVEELLSILSEGAK